MAVMWKHGLVFTASFCIGFAVCSVTASAQNQAETETQTRNQASPDTQTPSRAASFAGRVDEPVATVIYVEGAPQVARDGEVLPTPADFGSELENYDLIEAASGDLLELSLDPRLGVAGRLTLQPETVLSLEADPRLLRGSITVDLAGIAEGREFVLHTPGPGVSVRGTEFVIDVALTGDVLVAAREGIVEVSMNDGRRLFARSGRVVRYRRSNNSLRNVSVPNPELDGFRRSRRADARTTISGEPQRVTDDLLPAYRAARETFLNAYGSVMARRDILDAWVDAHRRRSSIAEEELSQQLARIEDSLTEAMGALRDFEPLFHRAEAIRRLVEEHPAASFTTLSEEVEADRQLFRRRMRVLRYMRKLHDAAVRTGGTPTATDAE
jgi:hypothetical protein